MVPKSAVTAAVLLSGASGVAGRGTLQRRGQLSRAISTELSPGGGEQQHSSSHPCAWANSCAFLRGVQSTENQVDSVVNAAAKVGSKGGSIAVKVHTYTHTHKHRYALHRTHTHENRYAHTHSEIDMLFI